MWGALLFSGTVMCEGHCCVLQERQGLSTGLASSVSAVCSALQCCDVCYNRDKAVL